MRAGVQSYYIFLKAMQKGRQSYKQSFKDVQGTRGSRNFKIKKYDK